MIKKDRTSHECVARLEKTLSRFDLVEFFPDHARYHPQDQDDDSYAEQDPNNDPS